MNISCLTLLTALLPLFAVGQATVPSPLAGLAALEGSWEGTSKGEPGTGKVERSYQTVLGGRFLEMRNRSVWVPTEKNPKGEIHEDRGFISFDRTRKLLVFRQFHVEGFVNQYTAAPGAAAAGPVVFSSEVIENIPAGWRARETYRLPGPDELIETFELAAPGQDFTVYSESRLKRRTTAASSESEAARQIIALERKAMDGWISGNPDPTLALADPAITYYHVMTGNRLDGLPAVRALYEAYRAMPLYDRYEMEAPRVQLAGDTAVLTYILVRHNGAAVSRWNSTQVYRHGDEGWRVIHAHWSQTKPPLATP